MKFTVNLDLENDTMKTYQDIRDALKQIILSAGSCASSHARPTDGDGGKILDVNGNVAGNWEVKRDLSAALDAVADQRWADAHEPDTPSTAQGNINSEAYHIFSDKEITGFCDHCGMRKYQPYANHAN